MIKGIAIGLIIAAIIFFACYNLLGYGAYSCGPGIGFILVPIALLVTGFTGVAFLRNKSITVSMASKIVIVASALYLLTYMALFFL
jgi:hypothetical protein